VTVDMPPSTPRLVPSAGAVALDEDGRILLVQRRTEPWAGLWSIPGGKCLAGEDSAAAAVRETFEETGLLVVAKRLLGQQVLPFREDLAYANADWLVSVWGGQLRAADDALDVRWVATEDLHDDVLTPGLRHHLTAYGVLPAAP
jgi:8-oxo-dGTP diphosphatase